MNRTQDRLAVSCEFLHQIADGPRSLTVETGSGFIEEQQQFGTGGELDADGEALAF
jgi:hypothetical protein